MSLNCWGEISYLLPLEIIDENRCLAYSFDIIKLKHQIKFTVYCSFDKEWKEALELCLYIKQSVISMIFEVKIEAIRLRNIK